MSASDEIEYFYAAHSAFAYIGAEMLGQVAKAGGRRIVHRPMHLGTVMKAATPNSERGFTGSITLARTNYFFRREIERWAEYRGVPVMRGIPQYHYHDITLPNCLLIAAIESGADIDTLSHAVLQAHWRDDADLANAGTLHAIADGCGCDGAALLELAASPEIKAQYEKNTAEAIERSVFGSPTYVVDGDMFYGQDHLELLARAMKQPFKDTWDRFEPA